ncbi:hypothetical protein D3C76_1161620 [compost metagenome]
MHVQRVVAGDRLRRVRFVVAQRTHAGVSPDDIVTAQLFLEVVVIHFQQVVDFVIVNLHVFRIAVVFHVGGADDGELVIPWDHEDDTVVFVLQNIGLRLIVHARHHDVAAFDQADTVR